MHAECQTGYIWGLGIHCIANPIFPHHYHQNRDGQKRQNSGSNFRRYSPKIQRQGINQIWYRLQEEMSGMLYMCRFKFELSTAVLFWWTIFSKWQYLKCSNVLRIMLACLPIVSTDDDINSTHFV